MTLKGQEGQEFQDECSEIHTIQVFRDACVIYDEPMMITNDAVLVDAQSSPIVTKSCAHSTVASSDQRLTMTPVPYIQAEVYGESKHELVDDGIVGDWAVDTEMISDDDSIVIEEALPPSSLQGAITETSSSLYSFYFETPLAQQPQQEETSDDFTITSHDTESFHDTTDLNLNGMEDSASFWEQGLGGPVSFRQEHDRCISPAHVSISGDDQTMQRL